MRKIKVCVRHFWPGFRISGSIFDAALRSMYDITYVASARTADVVLSSNFLSLGYRAVRRSTRRGRSGGDRCRIFYSGENWNIDYDAYDGIISPALLCDERHLRLPQWVHYVKLWEPYGNCTGSPDAGFEADALRRTVAPGTRKFACAVLRNPHYIRMIGLDKLRAFGPVDLFGSWSGRPLVSKMEVLPGYDFNLCFENSLMPGYITEKVLHAKLAGCVPIWWGDPAYTADFERGCLINMYDYRLDFSRMFEELDIASVRRTPLITGPVPDYLAQLTAFLSRIIG
jgi:alpha(1,3/1,4) fucosyltransferase